MLLLLAVLQVESLESLTRHWRADDLEEREAATYEIIRRRAEWVEADYLVLDGLAADPDVEVALRAKQVLTRLAVYRAVGGPVIEFVGGEEAYQAALSGGALALLDRLAAAVGNGDLCEDDLAGVAREAIGWGIMSDALLDRIAGWKLKPFAVTAASAFKEPQFQPLWPKAAMALAATGNADYAGELVTPLAGPSVEAQVAAARAFGVLRAVEHASWLEPLLRSASPDVRRAAAETLASFGATEPLLAFVEQLKSESPALREQAEQVVAALDVATRAKAVRPFLSDALPRVRIVGLRLLAAYDAAGHKADFLAALDDADAAVVSEALIAVRAVGVADDAPRVARLLDRDDPELRARAAETLIALSGDRYAREIASLMTDANGPTLHLVKRLIDEIEAGDVARDVMVEFLKVAEAPQRLAAVRALRLLGARDRAAAVAALAADAEADIRLEAIHLLAEIDARAEIDAVLRATDDADDSVRAAAVEAVARLGEPAHADRLIPRLDDESWRVREKTIRCLVELGAPGLGDRFAALLSDRIAVVSSAASEALVVGEAAEQEAAIAAHLRHADAAVRRHAALALGRLRLAAQRDAVAALLKDPDPDVRLTAVFALGEMGDAGAAEPLAKALGGDEDVRVRAAAARALGARGRADAVAALLREDHPDIVEPALNALAEIGDKSQVGAVARLFDHEEAGVRDLAAGTLAALGDGTELDRIAAMPPGRGMAAYVAKFGDASHVPLLAGLLARGETAALAADGLARIGGDKARAAFDDYVVRGGARPEVLAAYRKLGAERPPSYAPIVRFALGDDVLDLADAVDEAALPVLSYDARLQRRVAIPEFPPSRAAFRWIFAREGLRIEGGERTEFRRPPASQASLADLLEGWARVNGGAYVIDGDAIRLMSESDAVAWWKARLEKR